MRQFLRALNLLMICALLLGVVDSVMAQEGGEEAFIAGLIPKLSPEAKVGQLFVVGFQGANIDQNSDVADLIRTYQIGGVVLSNANGNITNTADAPQQVAALTSQLQSLSRSARLASNAPFIPLFAALQQDGDGAPNSEITSGLTPAPSVMALGATWSTDEAEAIGNLVGKELSALGVNLLLGPSLDVRTQPSTSSFDPGVNVFGGDHYWVGMLGQAYVRGMQAGSEGRLATVAKHFPGQGSLDDASVTLDRSLDDLKQIDLPPFERLMLNPTGKGRPLADALLTTNVRYRGFNGNIRERTAPISIDNDALQTLLSLPEVKAWRDNGGLLVSDALGAPSVREYYSTTTSAPISITQAALETFQAGNDVLILDNLSGGSVENNAALIREVIQSFRQKYSTDPAFQQRVDSAVQRILRLKYRLYPNFDFTKVQVPVEDVASVVNTGGAQALNTANTALTLLWPKTDQLTSVVPKPTDTFLIATDTRPVQACPGCVAQPTLGVNELAQSISQLYSVPPQNITSTTFSELKAFVTGAPNAPDLAPAFNNATWVVLAMQAIDPAYPSSDAAKLLLDSKPELLNGKHSIGFMFGPPYGLTADEISRFSALYALYGKLPPNVEVATHALAGDFVAPGRSPVNLPALGYDLTQQTGPDPRQVIPLAVGEEAVPGQPTPAPLNLHVGDTARIRTGTIVDHNGHPIPDGTPVQFNFQYDGDPSAKSQNAVTVNGVARTEFVLDKVGRLLIHATSEPALNSTTLQITISQSGAVVATLQPSPTPTVTAIPTPTSTPHPTLTPTATPTPSFFESLLVQKPKNAQWGELLLALISVAVVGGAGYWFARRNRTDLTDALRLALWAAIGGLIGYVYFGLSLPGSDLLRAILGSWAALPMVIAGGVIPLLYASRK